MFLILLILFIALLCIIVIIIVTIYHFSLSRKTIRWKKIYAALLINSHQTIDFIVPISKQKRLIFSNYTKLKQTQMFHPCVKVNDDYYKAILFAREHSHFTVRETKFIPRIVPQMNIDWQRGNYLIEV